MSYLTTVGQGGHSTPTSRASTSSGFENLFAASRPAFRVYVQSLNPGPQGWASIRSPRSSSPTNPRQLDTDPETCPDSGSSGNRGVAKRRFAGVADP